MNVSLHHRRSVPMAALGLLALLLAATALPAAAQEPLFEGVQVVPDDCLASMSLAEPNSARRLAISPTGDIYVALNGYLYCENSTDGGIWVTRSTDRGESFGPLVQVLDSFEEEAYPQGDPSVAVDEDGVVHVAWMAYLRGEQLPAKRAQQIPGYALFYSRSTDGGASFSPPAAVAEGYPGQGEGGLRVHIAVDSPYVYLLPTPGDTLFVNGASGAGPFGQSTLFGPRVYSDVHVDQATGDVYVQTDDPLVRVYQSTDHGASFGPESSWEGIDVYFSNAALGAGPSGAASLFIAGATFGDGEPNRGPSPYPARSARQAGKVRTLDVGDVGWRIDLATMTPTAIEVGVNENSYGRQLAADECGNVVDAYIGYPDGPVGYFRTSTDGGSTWSEEVLVGWTYRMHVAIHPLTKDVVVLYESEGGPRVNVYEGLLRNCNCPGEGAEILTPASVCEGSVNDASIGPFEGVTYYWSITPYTGNAAIIGPENGPSIVWRADVPGLISVECTIFGPGCVKRFWKNVIVNPTPAAPAISVPEGATTGQTGVVASVPATAGSAYDWTVTNGTITSGQGTHEITFTAGLPGSASLEVVETTAAGCVSPAGTATIRVSGPGGPCFADGTTLCLNLERFEVKVSWKKPDGTTGSGQAVPFAPAPPDSGYFWFFDAANMELLVKVLDGRGVNGHFWVMYGALSDVEYTVTVRDTLTDAVKTYVNPQGTMASVADVEAFSDPAPRAAAGVDGWANASRGVSAGPTAAPAAPAVAASACTADGTTLCLNASRFKVTSSWKVLQPIRTNGPGHAVPVTTDTGCFWFFNDRNIELAVKVLDGTSFNGHYWVFYGALSDVEYAIEITDSVTGAVKTYENPQGTLGSMADTMAFAP